MITQAAAQRRTVGVLVGSQVLGGTGLAAGIAVGSLLAAQLSGSDALSGLGGTVQVLGAAVAAVPIASVTSKLGRRYGLVLGYLVGAIGAAVVVTAGIVESFALLLVGCALLGAGTASSSASRYAAAEELSSQLDRLGVAVIFDDRPKVSPGVKFKDAELIGVPTIVTVGRGLADGEIEVKDRATGERRNLAVDTAAEQIREIVTAS